MIPPIVTTPTTAPPPRTGRYSLAKARQEIVRVVQMRPRGTHVQLAKDLGIRSTQLSHRLSGAYKLKLEQIGIIADSLAAPTGWPFISWEEAERRDEAYAARNPRKSQE